VDDETIILADMAEKAVRQVFRSAVDLLGERMEKDKAEALAQILSEGRWTHDHALICSTLAEMGLPVSCQMPETVFRLMRLYRQPTKHQPAVEYLPLPYRKEKGR